MTSHVQLTAAVLNRVIADADERMKMRTGLVIGDPPYGAVRRIKHVIKCLEMSHPI